jgi:putative aldouronate transport system permease protein
MKISKGQRIFNIGNSIFLIIVALICVLPLVHIAAISFSSNAAASAGYVKFLPVEFNVNSYKYVLDREPFWRALWVSAQRVVLGVGINMFFTIIVAYPLSKESKRFKARTVYVWIFFFTSLFYGGLIPWYMVIYNLKLIDTIWALVLPTAVPVFNVILMLNFFRQIPIELEEAAHIDGANHWTTLWKIYIPTSLAAIATLTLFSTVFHWNSWFDGMIYMNRPAHYPMQTYLQTVIVMRDFSLVGKGAWKDLMEISDRTVKAAQIFMGGLPILLVYPFLQRYFVKGIVLGSVKG